MPPLDVQREIRDHILRSGLRSGDRLPPERELAEQLGVSRNALREAMRRLLDLGVLQARQGAGTFLVELDLDDLLEVRLALEPLAARRAAERRRAPEMEALVRLRSALAAAVDDAPRFAALDLELHRTIARASRSVPLERLLSSLDDMQELSRLQTAGDDALRARSLRDLERLVDVVTSGRPADAEAAMRRHLVRVAGRAR